MQSTNLPISLLDIPDVKKEQLKKKGFQTLEDLLRFYPRRYEDRSNVAEWGKLGQYVGKKVAIVGILDSIHVDYNKNYVFCKVVNMSNKEEAVSITWFHQNYIARQLIRNAVYYFFGKLTYNDRFGFQITNPTSFNTKPEREPLPIYPAVKGMSAEYIGKCVAQAMMFVENTGMSDTMDDEFRQAIGVEGVVPFLKKVHTPKTMEDVHAASKRMAADLMLPFAVEMMKRKYEVPATTSKVVEKTTADAALNALTQKLSFTFTADQKTAIDEMSECVCTGRRLSVLLQGDVSCGKTVVAEAMAAIVAAGGYQVAVMAPTGVLATQHFLEFQKLFEGTFSVEMLHTGMKVRERKQLLARIKSGDVNIVIGTHAIVSNDVEFCNLGLTIVDEEHRFGVEQREALRNKAVHGAHSISMSATPIPRSLALALYGDDLTIHNIKTMPSGRKPVKTIAYSDERKTYMSAYKQIQLGHQVYVICPLIEDSEASGMEDVDSVDTTAQKLQEFFAPYPEVKIATITGKMKEADIRETIQRFANKEYDILLSTTIVEVGVNVPNATVMVIKNAERYGLAQLHQLRGRVGRGDSQSYCVLLSKDIMNPRLQTMVKTNSGFDIAQADLEMRGAGTLTGTEQSGYDVALDAMLQNPDLYQKMMAELKKIFDANARYAKYRALAN